MSTTSLSSSSSGNWKIVLKKVFTVNLQPTEENFPELPDVMVWFRCIIAIAYGTYIGYNNTNVKGSSLLVLMQALNLLVFIPVLHCRLYLGIHRDVFPGKIVFSGLLNGLALILLLWIYFFTSSHPTEVSILQSMLLDTNTTSTISDTTSDSDATTSYVDPEPEF